MNPCTARRLKVWGCSGFFCMKRLANLAGIAKRRRFVTRLVLFACFDMDCLEEKRGVGLRG